MARSQALNIILRAGIAFAAMAPTIASADIYGDFVKQCHAKTASKCRPPYDGNQFQACYVATYNECMKLKVFIKAPLRN